MDRSLLASLHSSGMKSMVQCLQISKSAAHGRTIFKNANLEVRNGDLVFLLGRCGTGKSLLFRLLLGLEPLDQGNLFVDGLNVQHGSPKDKAFLKRCVGMVFQDLKLIMDRTVYENVALPLEIQGRDRLFILRRVHRMLRLMDMDPSRIGAPCRDLSAGERQYVAIARALAHNPALVLMDEPTGNLDAAGTERVMGFLHHLHSRGTTVMVATHDSSLPAKLPQSRTVCIHDAQFIESPPSKMGLLRR